MQKRDASRWRLLSWNEVTTLGLLGQLRAEQQLRFRVEPARPVSPGCTEHARNSAKDPTGSERTVSDASPGSDSCLDKRRTSTPAGSFSRLSPKRLQPQPHGAESEARSTFGKGLVVFNAGAASDEFRQLRALSVAPCALVPHGEPLQILAQLCTRLEELDVRRSGRDDDENSVHCPNCSVGLILRHSHLSDPAFRNWKYALRRLTLYNVKLLEPLHPFPCAFNVSELRLCGVDFLSGNRLGLIVRTSPHLTSLLVQHDKLPLFGKSLRRELTALRACAPSQLRSLSLLSKIGARTVAVARFADDLLTAMPLLVSLHVHYAAEVSGGFERRVTWVRRVRGWFMDRAERCTDVVIVEEDSGVLCCTSTFVGMEKPQNRNFCRL
ncbi:hypothetical protein HPB51_011858 [Rhipicephalus microplus]|uniref:Uncharacterized protein n=1 Tax=Rhipicephalus microplus TaxID=6941 RepID=A0A9J6E907_RHIMP|nr:hypothetical protein HPB51_011858 [Rhipicephalus microplus]